MRIVVRGAPEAPALRASAIKKNIGHFLKCSADVLKCTDGFLKCSVGGVCINMYCFRDATYKDRKMSRL